MNPSVFGVIPVAMLGAVIGSFLNVVIYRLPRGLSISRPRWSFCPSCQTRIRPRHNIPIVGWLALRGRCASCRSSICLTYPIIECTTALIFLLVWDALFLTETVPGVHSLYGNWPVWMAYMTLFACLLAMAAMDFEAYCIDIQVCFAAMVAGVVGHGINGLPNGLVAPAAGVLPPSVCAAALAGGGAWVLTFAASRLLQSGNAESSNEPVVEAAEDSGLASESDAAFQPGPVIALAGIVVLLAGVQIARPFPDRSSGLSLGELRGLAGCAVLMVVLILASMVPRTADEEILEEINAGRATARRLALGEAVWLLPALLAGIGTWMWIRSADGLNVDWYGVFERSGAIPAFARHVAGIGHALTGLVLAAALGWSVRLLGTLGFGKEAFGVGDIYILAAIGAATGFWTAFFAFFLAAILALIGVLATLFRKNSRAIPFGPWLALGALAAVWLDRALMGILAPTGHMLWSIVTGTPL